MNLLIYDKDGFIKTFPRNDLLEKDINDILCLNGIHTASGKYIADTSTGLVKGRKDAYLSYKRFIERLDKNSKCTSGNVLKKIRQIENADCMPEYAGVLLYFLNKKYKELLKRGK